MKIILVNRLISSNKLGYVKFFFFFLLFPQVTIYVKTLTHELFPY